MTRASSTNTYGYDAENRMTGRAVGTPAFVADLERLLGRPIARRAAGRKPLAVADAQLSML